MNALTTFLRLFPIFLSSFSICLFRFLCTELAFEELCKFVLDLKSNVKDPLGRDSCDRTRLSVTNPFSLRQLNMAPGRGTFGLSSARGRGRGNFRANYRGGSWRGRGRGRGGSKATGDAVPIREDDGTQLAERFERAALNDEVDEKLGFGRIQEGVRREGWLVNMHPVSDLWFGLIK